MLATTLEPIIANEKERLALREMEKDLDNGVPSSPLPQLVGRSGKTYAIPMPIVQLLRQAIDSMLRGNAVSVVLYNQSLDTRDPDKPEQSAIQQAEPQPYASESLEALAWIEETTGFSQERVGQLLGVTGQTVSEWQQARTPISDEQCERLLTVREILGHALSHQKEPLATWLDTPRRVDDPTPAQLLAADEMGKARFQAVASPLRPNLRNRPAPKQVRPSPREIPWEEPIPSYHEIELERWLTEHAHEYEENYEES
jgi:transcriptional regulator with XRE-family HTH domain